MLRAPFLSPPQTPLHSSANRPQLASLGHGTTNDSFTPQAAATSPVTPRFASHLRRGGTTLYHANYRSYYDKHRPRIEALIADWNTRKLDETLPEVKKIYALMRLEGWPGIPPRVGTPPENGKSTDTRAVLGLIVFRILEELLANQRPSCLAEALAQMDLVFDLVMECTIRNYSRLPKNRFPSGLLQMNRDTSPATGIGSEIYSQIYKGHLVFAAQNGAIQAMRLPTPQQMIDMLKNDPGAQAYVEKVRPLGRHSSLETFGALPPFPWEEADLAGTLKFLAETTEGLHQNRGNKAGFTDIHNFISCIPFDYGKHIQSGILQPIVDLPGADRRTVWQTVDMAEVQSSKRYTGWSN